MIHLNFNPFPVLTTERLVLREMSMDDTEPYFIIRADEEMNKYIPNPRPKNHEETQAIIERMMSYARDNKSVAWTIADKETNQMLGSMCLWTMQGNDDGWEVGYAILTEHQNKGLMSEALQATVKYGFEVMNLPMIHAYTHKDNASSRHMLEKNGFARNTILEATQSEIEDMKEEMQYMVIYTLQRV
ncbi:MAG: GNAT family N-acetyltransferase [Flavipsychrobacter sp.]|nr:GNAT family N-acetyltransferase [Flavipsychrobacter sp.]